MKLLLFILIIGLTSCFQLFDDPTTTLDKALSNPNRTKKAVLLHNDGGTTVDRSLQVSILNYDYMLTGKELGNVFVVDRDHGATGLTLNSINFNWLSNDTLQIDYDKKLRTFLQQKKVEGVTLVYKSR